jgi:hypothetical protein
MPDKVPFWRREPSTFPAVLAFYGLLFAWIVVIGHLLRGAWRWPLTFAVIFVGVQLPVRLLTKSLRENNVGFWC